MEIQPNLFKNQDNVTWITRNFKLSTLVRIKERFNYKNDQELNDCPFLTFSRKNFDDPRNPQEALFDYLEKLTKK
jgi:hypothetical protein